MTNKYNLIAVDFNPFQEGELEMTVNTTESQKEIWLACILGGNESNCSYNESLSLELHGKFDFQAMQSAFQDLIQRHESLRSNISADGDYLCIYKYAAQLLSFEDISSITDQQQYLKEFNALEANKAFDLQKDLLFKSTLFKLTDTRHVLKLTAHHIVCDGWSFGIILEDLGKLYSAYVKGEIPQLEPATGFSVYAKELQKLTESPAYNQTVDYWVQQYKGNIPELDLPVDAPRPATRTYKSNRTDVTLDPVLLKAVKKTGAQAGCSLVNTLMAAFEIYLSKLTGQTDIVLGLPSSGQSFTGHYSVVGHCVNLLPLRSRLETFRSFTDYLKICRVKMIDHYEHQQFTFGSLLKKLNIPRNSSRIPLVPVIFNIDMGMDGSVFFEGLQHELHSNPKAYENFELFLNATGTQDSLVMEWSYNSQLFMPDTIQRMINGFTALLHDLTEHSDVPVNDLEVFQQKKPAAESQLETEEFTQSLLPNLFADIAETYPDHTAIHFKNNTVSYRKLREASDLVAYYLIGQGIEKGDVVAILLDRSERLVICLMGILKAGAAYLPLDPEYPQHRIEFMLEDSGAKLLLTSANHKTKFNSKVHEHDIEQVLTTSAAKGNVGIPAVTGSDLAYILYTSGSTGKPKGVKITHHNLSNFLLSMQAAPGITDQDRLLAITTISFDIAGLELYLPLISGAQIVLADTTTARDGRLLLKLIEDKNITLLQATPSTLQMILDSGWEKKYPVKILSGGEALGRELANQLLQRSDSLWNMYGPTETTIWSTVKHLTVKDKKITIGGPIRNTQIYILDEQGHQLEPGLPGEIHIGGDGVAAGYLNRPDLNAEKFISDPYSKVPGAKLYRTGDLGKLLENGEFECLGRIDQQVKIRGHRIELGEIETALSAQKEVKQSVVLAREDTPGHKRLIAYVILDTSDNKEEKLAWKERWDSLYTIGSALKKESGLSTKNLDDTLLEHYQNSSELALQAKEWLQVSAERIKNIGSKKIYEIGSGGGQLLFELANSAELYVATDYAQTAIDKLNEKLQLNREEWAHVHAEAVLADDFTYVADQSFDLVLIHSVAQYFPDVNYLIEVIKKSAASIKNGGCIFIGDMQGKNSLEMYHAMDYLSNTPDSSTLATFSEVVANRVRIEDELVADPEFFYGLSDLIPGITNVNIQLREGTLLNETTKYHYDVWLYIDKPHHQTGAELKLDYRIEKTSIDEIGNILATHPSSVIEIKNVDNARTIKDHRLLELIKHSSGDTLMKSIKTAVAQASGGLTPDVFWGLGKKYHFNTHVRWQTDGTDGLFNVVFIPITLQDTLPEPAHKNKSTGKELKDYIRNPFSKQEVAIPKELIQTWKRKLSGILPAYMVPEDFIALKKFPLTPNAKIDRNALPKPQSKKDEAIKTGRITRTKNEQLISNIWSEVLGLDDIKLTDDFFEVGGHSLLAVKVMVAIEKQTGIRLPLAILFENSTIEKLALKLSDDETEEIWEAVVPIKTQGKKTPLFLIHGGGMNILLFKSLIEHFDHDQPIYAIQALGLNKETTVPETLEKIAGIYIKEMLKINPTGPYALAGYSLGGFIAYEIAKQLKEMGKEIKLLGMIDTYAGNHSLDLSTSQRLYVKTKRQFNKIPFLIKSILNYPKEALMYQYHFFKRKLNPLLPAIDNSEVSVLTDYEKGIYEAYDKALDNYKLSPCDAMVTLFRVNKRLYYLDDRIYLGWNKYAMGGVDVYEIPGDHKTFLYPPNDKKFVEIIQGVMNKNEQHV
ncbi:non-ribosomal peptide synthetase [Pedobacter nutrimenti]|uniref:Amino acid adenylation domain-containing protein n=1 Tax=Pedobacter nutrimenti TaxID=1241337 RepID=A0A318UMX8_9SPHI|nr:non-ribosomal peptide synthetase [Pedobacter nutrimenti]PYF76880.1 amino acid adenylation domain-containing protein [Pedobacter nutrimenti]